MGNCGSSQVDCAGCGSSGSFGMQAGCEDERKFNADIAGVGVSS
jgi:hypothetical protein